MTTKIFGYARVSSNEQREDRQIQALLDLGVDERDIYVDKCSGKDFNRPQYQTLKNHLRKEDILIIKSIDRLGRNYKQICEEWNDICNNIQAKIKVIDMPTLDTTNDDNLTNKLINNIVLQLLSYVAEQERNFIKQRQKEGIEIAKTKGKKFGRPVISYPNNWHEVYKKWKEAEITAVAAMKQLNLKPTTFYKLAKQFNENLDDVV